MKINFFSPSFGLTPAIVQHIETRLSMALATASGQIDHIIVRVEDINGKRGGIDKQCRITVRHQYLPTFTVEATHHDLYMAITEATSKVKENLWRHLLRRRTLRRRHLKRPQRQMLA